MDNRLEGITKGLEMIQGKQSQEPRRERNGDWQYGSTGAWLLTTGKPILEELDWRKGNFALFQRLAPGGRRGFMSEGQFPTDDQWARIFKGESRGT